MAALHVAARRGMDFGTEVVFTYGPLGFLGVPRYHYPVTTALALLFALAVRAAFCGVLLSAFRRAVPLPVAVLLAYAASRLVAVEAAELLVLVALVWSVLAVRGLLPAPVVAGGVVAGVATLVKFNAGVAVLAFVVVTAVAARRSVPRAVAAYAATVVALWLAARQPLDALPAYLRGSWEVTAGYTAAMANELPGLGWHYAVAPLLAAAVVALAATVPGVPRRERVGVVLLVLGGLALEAKRGFVRHDAHAEVYFLACALLPLALTAGRLGARWLAGAGLAVAGVGVVVWSFAPVAEDLLDPVSPARAAATEARAMATPGGREALLAAGRARVGGRLKVPPAMLARIGDRSVHVDPWDASAVWAYGLRWRPAPVFQSYSAYTPWLDDRTAEGLSADVVLRRVPAVAVDDRVPSFESPAYVQALVCSYREVAEEGGWQLLERSAGPRCGTPVRVGTLPPDGTVPVAGSGQLLYLRVRTTVPLADRLLSAVAKPPTRAVELDGRRWRFLSYYVDRPLVVGVPPEEEVLPGRAEHRAVRSFRLPDWPARYEVEVWSVPLAP